MFCFGQVNDFLTGLGTAGLGFGLAAFALDKQQMTGLVGAVDMGVTRGPTLVALGNDVLRNPLGSPLVKNKVFSHKGIFQSLVIHQ